MVVYILWPGTLWATTVLLLISNIQVHIWFSHMNQTISGHNAPVLSADFHRASGSIDFSHIFLTCSSDWTVMLWSVKVGYFSICSTIVLGFTTAHGVRSPSRLRFRCKMVAGSSSSLCILWCPRICEFSYSKYELKLFSCYCGILMRTRRVLY